MQTPQYAVIAAAGLGSRLGLGRPKCLAEIAGRAILDYQLELLREVPDVRVVVGYQEHDVMTLAFKLRPDLIVVRNPAFRSTTTQHSYWLGARRLREPCLYLDGDIIFDPASFKHFLSAAAGRAEPLIGITSTKTEHAVYVHLDQGGSARSFSRTEGSAWEWANVALLPAGLLEENGGDVFSRLAQFTPLATKPIDCYEVDTESDLAQAEAFARELGRLAESVTPQATTPAVARE